jgi:hypothetical protein
MNKTITLMLIALLTMIVCSSCLRVKKFTKEELKWVNPYSKTDTIIYQSEKNELDTIIFFAVDTIYWKERNFIEVGFFNETNLSVRYQLTDGSYHQSATMSDGITKYEQYFVSITNSSSKDWSSIEITFLGSFYNGQKLSKDIMQLDDKNYYFGKLGAKYIGMGVVEGINDFTFNTDIGIVEYTDIRDVLWTRKKKE